MAEEGRRIERFEDLDVWRKAHKLVLLIYEATSSFPKEELYGLVSQMRRAAVSVPANLAEGFKRRGQKDKVHFYNISQSSLEELRYYQILSRDLRYLVDGVAIGEQIDEVGRMLYGLVRSIHD